MSNSIATCAVVLGVVLFFAAVVWLKAGPTVSRERQTARETNARIHPASDTTTEGTHQS